MRITSGCKAGSSSTACWPSAHSATTSNPSAGDRIRARPARTMAWSSTRATRIMASARPRRYRVLRVQRKPAAHPPALRCRPGRELAAERGRPLPHPDQAVPGSLGLRGRSRRSSARSSRRRGAPARRPPPSPERSARAARAVPRSRAPPGKSGRARLRRSARCGRGPRAYAAGPRDHRLAHGRRAREISLTDGSGGATAASSSLRSSATVRRSSCMLRRPTSSADRNASSAAAGSRRSTWRALVI